MGMASHGTVRLSAKAFPMGQVALTPSWISNGHWAVRRNVVANREHFATREAVCATFRATRATVREGPDQTLVKGVSGFAVHAWHATDEVREVHTSRDHYSVRIFASENGTGVAGFNTEYLELFGMNTASAVLYGATPDRPFRDAKRFKWSAFVIMPVRL
jgi:hypothetical protein